MPRTAKLTAKNSAYLAAAKQLFSAPIYARVAVIVNDAGIEDSRDWLRSLGLPTRLQDVAANVDRSLAPAEAP